MSRSESVVLFRELAVGVVLLSAVSVAGNIVRRGPLTIGEVQQPTVKRLAHLGGFSDWVTSLAFSPNGKSLAVGSYEVVQLWKPQTKKLIATLPLKSGYVKAVTFSPDGKLLAVGSYQSLGLWDVETRKPIRELQEHTDYVTGVAFSPDGKLLATSSEDETIRICDAAHGKTQRVIRGHSYPVQAVVFSPDGRFLASAAGDESRVTKPGEVKIWDVATGKERRWKVTGKDGQETEQATLPEPEKVATDVAFSLDGKFLVSTSHDETVNVYDVATGKALGFFGGHSRPTNSVVFAVDGRTVLSAGGGRAKGGNNVKIWNRSDGEEKATIKGHQAKVTCVALAPDGKMLATGSYDRTVALWDVGPILFPVQKPANLK